MLTQAATIARNTFVESLRQPIYLVMLLACGVLQVFNTWTSAFSMGYTTSSEVSGDDKILFDVGLATVFVCGMLLAAFVATSVLSREIENKTVLTVVSKPIGRTTVILGKYAGVAGAITIAVVVMLCFLLWGIRHGVMTRVSDDIDYPVLIFGLGSVGLSLLIGAWCNFFYNWSFSQTAVLSLGGLCLAMYPVTLLFAHDFARQPIGTDFKPQIMLAGLAVLMSMYLLTAIATAASSRLGQVMTILICAGFFVFGLMSNHFIGRHAFVNAAFARITTATPVNPEERAFDEPRMGYRVTIDRDPNDRVEAGMTVYYGASPNGLALVNGGQGTFRLSNPPEFIELFGPDAASGVVIREYDGARDMELVHAGVRPLALARPPREGDFLFLQPTQSNPAALVLWGIVPNMQFYWLIDAVTQTQAIPLTHLGLVFLYTACQVGAALCVAVLLFQKRDVG
ncbi:MAG: ABC transporter permease [Planctomycetota bacterium]